MADSLFKPLNIDVQLPETPAGGQGSLFGLAAQKGFDLEQAVARNQRNVEKSIVGKLGLDPNGVVGQYTNLLASTASGAARVTGNLATLGLDTVGAMAQASVPEEQVQAYNRTLRGEATAEDAALLNQTAPGDDGIPQTYFQRLEGTKGIQQASQKVADFFDIASIVDTTRRDRLSDDLKESTANGVAQLRDAYAAYQRGDYGDAALEGAGGLFRTIGSALATGVTDPGAVAEYAAENVPQIAAHVINPVLGLATNLGYGADIQRDAMATYFENNNGQFPDADERLQIGVSAALAAGAEQIGDIGLLRGMRVAGTGLGSGAARIAGGVAREAATEGFQTVQENNAKFEDTSLEEIVEAATIGGLVGGTFQGGAEISNAISRNAADRQDSAPDQNAEDLTAAALDSGDVSDLVSQYPDRAVSVLAQLSEGAEPEVVQANLAKADEIEQGIQSRIDDLQANMENNSEESVQEFRDILDTLTPDDADYVPVQQALEEAESYTPEMRKQDEAAVAQLQSQLAAVREAGERMRVDTTPDVDQLVADVSAGDVEAGNRALTLTMQNPDAIDPSVAAEMSRNEALPMEQRDALAKFAVAQEASNALKDRVAVNTDVLEGGTGFKGLNQYRSAVRSAVQSNDFDKANTELQQLESFAATRESKANAIANAYEQVKGTNSRVFIAPDAQGNWVTTPTKQANGLAIGATGFRLRDDVRAEATALRTGLDALQSAVAASQARNMASVNAVEEVATGPVEGTTQAVTPAPTASTTTAPVAETTNLAPAEPVMTGELTALRNRTGEPITSDNYQKVNLLGEAFVQEAGRDTDASVRPLAATPNFMSKVRAGEVNLKEFVGQKAELSPNQRTAVNRFFGFQKNFDQFVQQGFTRRRDPAFRFQDYSQFLINDDGTVDENARTAISVGAFTWTAENVNSLVNTQEGINMILGREAEEEISSEAYAVLGRVGTREDVVANQLGARIAQALGIRARPDAAANEQARLESALGIQAIGAMVRSGMMKRTEISDATLQRLRGSTEPATKAVHTFVNLTHDDVDGRPRANATAQAIREGVTGSQSVLNKLFSTEASGIEPSYEPVKFDQTFAKRTGQLIPKVLADTLEKEGAKAHRVRQDMYQVWGNLSAQALYRIAGVVNDKALHIENIASQQAKNEGLMAQVDNLTNFINKMVADPTTEGLEQPLYFGRSVWKPQRVGLNTNVINPQTSKVHRHMLAMDNWESEVDTNDVQQMNNFKLRVMEAFGKKTEAKATQLVLADYDALVNDPAIQGGVDSLAKILRGESDMSANQEQAITDAVDAAGENFHSLDALVALAHQKNAVDGKFKTTFMGEVDGLTNGPMLSLLMLGAKDMSVMNQGGFFSLSDAYTQFNDFKGDGNLDLYESTVKGALARLDVKDSARLDALQVITGQLLTDEGNVTSKGRNVIKKPFTAMMFGSNTATAVLDMAQGFVDSIYSKMEDMAAKGDEAGMTSVINAANTLIGKKNLMLDPRMGIAVAMETKLSAKQQEMIRGSFFELLGQHVQSSLEDNYGVFLERRNVVNQSAQLAFRLYDAAYQALVKKAEETSPSIARRTTRNGQSQALRTLTEAELRGIRNQLKGMEPILMTAMAKKSGNQLEAGMHMSKTRRELDPSLPFSSEVYFGEEVETFDEQGRATRRKTTSVNGMRTLATDPGVAPFITSIHSTDSAIASQVYALLNALNVHDALGVGLHSVEQVGQLLNQATYENTRDYSAASEMVNTLERVVTGLNKLMADPDTAALIQPELKKITAELTQRKLGTIEEHLDRARNVAVAADTAKLEMLTNMKAVGQYATEGGSYMVTDQDRAAAQAALDAVGTEFNQDAVAAAANLDSVTAAEPLLRKAGTSQQLSNNSVQTLTPATSLNTLERIKSPEADAVHDALLNNVTLEAAKEVLDAPQAAELVQQVADNTRPRMSVWGELGQPVIQSNQVLVDLMQTTQLNARQLVESLEALNTDGFTARLLNMIKRTVPADMPVNYITSETGPEGALGTGVSKARGWYHQEGGFQSIYVKSPEFVESGITPEMLTHELVHAALGQIVAEHTGKNTEAGKAVTDLENLRAAAEKFIGSNTELASKFRNATGNVHEMLAWGLTNQDFQQDVLAKIPAQTKSKGLLNGLTDFINSLTRLIFRGNATAADRTGLGQLVAQSAGLFREAANLRATRNQQTMLYEDAIDHVNAMTSEEVLAALEGASPNVVSTQHQQRLVELVRDFVEPIYGPYGAFKEEASANRAITPMDVYMKSLASGKKPFASRATTGPFAMTQQEGFALESVQAVLEETLRNPNTVFLRQALTNLFNEAALLPVQAFHNGDWATASQQEKDLAQEKKDFIFKLSPGITNKSGYLAQFAALTLASEEVRAVMDFTTAGLPTPPKTAPIGTRLIALFRKAMAQLASLVTKVKAGERAVDSIRTLASELVDIEAARKARLSEDRLNALDQVEVALGNVGNSLRERAEALGNMPFFTQSSSGYVKGAGSVIRTVAGGRVEELLDHMSNIRDKRFAGQKHGITQGIIEEMRGVYDGNKVAAELFKGAKAIEKARKDMIENTVASVMASFKEGGQYLTQQDKNSITRVLLRTNAAALASAYGLAQTQEMIEKPEVLRTERNKLEQQLKGMTQHWGYMSAAAKDLAYHKVIGGNVSHNLMLNTGNIARLLGTKVANTLAPADVKAITELLDKLMPMYAIQYSNDLDVRRAVQVMRTESNRQDGNGIDMVLKLHAGMQKQSADKLFKGQETLQQSGYVPEIHDNKIEVLLVDRKNLESMEKAGYKQATELQKDATDGANDDRVMVTRRGAGPTALLTGSLSFTGMHRKGSSADRETVNLLQGTNTTSQQHVALIRKNKEDLVADLFSRGLSYDPRKVKAGVMVPVMHPNGQVVDYRYTMTEHNRDVLLDRDNSMEQVLGTMAGQIVDKVDTQQQNADVVRAMHDQYRDEYRTNPNKFVKFGKNSVDPDLAELYRLLPESTKREIKRVWKSDDMLIPANQLNLIVGYRKYSLTSTFDKGDRKLTARGLPGDRNWAEQLFVQVTRAFLGEKAALRVGQAEDLMQELVKEAKDILVVKNVTTLVGNMMSNISLLAVEGVPIRQMIESHAVAIKGATDYRKDAKRVMQIRQLLDIGYVVDGRDKLEQELVQAQDRMARNPIKPLIDAGLMPTIVEDVEADDSQYSYKSRLQRGVDKYTSRVPKMLKELGKQVYMTHDTSTYKFLSQTTQLSDLVARYALYQHLIIRQRDPLSSADALAQAEEAFVNYDLPSHRSIQFMNDTGLVMFTKYYMRIQKVIARLIRQKPARVLGLAAAEHFFSGIQSIMDSTWFNRIGNNPFGLAGLEYPSTLGELPTFKMLN